MTSTAAKIVIFAILALPLALFFSRENPQYFSCTGTKTVNGSEQSEKVLELSLKTEMIPWLQRSLFNSKQYGTVAFDSHRHYLQIFKVSDINVMMKGAAGAEGFGVFDRVSRRLVYNDGDQAYDVICKSTDSVEI